MFIPWVVFLEVIAVKDEGKMMEAHGFVLVSCLLWFFHWQLEGKRSPITHVSGGEESWPMGFQRAVWDLWQLQTTDPDRCSPVEKDLTSVLEKLPAFGSPQSSVDRFKIGLPPHRATGEGAAKYAAFLLPLQNQQPQCPFNTALMRTKVWGKTWGKFPKLLCLPHWPAGRHIRIL